VDVGFIGLGSMGFPIAARIVSAGHAAASVKEVGDHSGTVLASLPTPAVSQEVATGPGGVVEGTRVRRFIDLSTVGSQVAEHNHAALTAKGIAAFDGPVSGGVAGAENGTLTVMVSGSREEFDAVVPVIEAFGRAIFVDEKPGAAQTMKLVNNLMAATTLAATAEVMVMGVKAGLDASVMIDVLNAGSGGTHASRDKFPRAVLPRTFDYGFATGLMVKDIRLYLQEAEALGTPTPIAQAITTLWESVLEQQGATSDFTSVVKPFEAQAGVIVDGRSTKAPPLV
jgi:3-hydroxyisobutyrate dehydrogenase-like beta-hydroxyacid dehydrogenase